MGDPSQRLTGLAPYPSVSDEPGESIPTEPSFGNDPCCISAQMRAGMDKDASFGSNPEIASALLDNATTLSRSGSRRLAIEPDGKETPS